MKYLLMYNPVSGRQSFKKKLHIVKQFFDKTEHELDVYESTKEHDLMHQATSVASNYDVFLVAGGDGTVNEVINGLMQVEKKPIIGILPGGTANDTAAMLGIPRNTKKALKMIMSEEPVLMDINQMNDRYFVYTAASGVLSKISYDVSRRHIHKYGYLAYVFEAMKDLGKDYKYPLHIEYNNQTLELECMMALGIASRRVGGLWLLNFANSKLNDGLFELRIFERHRQFRIFRLVSFFLRGGRKLKEDYHLVSDHFKITTNDDVNWNADGEFAMKGSIEIKVHQKVLPIYVSSRIKKRSF